MIRNALFIFILLLFINIKSQSQERILIDGIFNDWSEIPIAYQDASGDEGSSNIDFGQLQIANDDQYLFFLLETGAEINLQDLNQITLYLDTDGDSNTGLAINGIGAEIVYAFGNRSGLFYEDGSSTFIGHEDIGLVTSPTVTSDRFEIAIRKDAIINGSSAFRNTEMGITFENSTFNGDVLPSPGDKLTYAFTEAEIDPLPYYSIQKGASADMRVLSFNVLFNGLFDQSKEAEFSRILNAMHPDIIGFQEIYDYSSAEVANKVESMLPSDSSEEWYHATAGPDCHAISRYPILKEALIPGYNSSAGNGAFLIDLPGNEKDLLLIVAHPPCCANNEGRQIEVDRIMEFVREAKNGSGPMPLEPEAPIIILGDMNLVGDHRQLETLLSGDISNEASYGPDFKPDWDGSDFKDSNPYITGLPLSFTWYDEGSSFSPGKLDYIIYSGSNLELQNTFSLFTPSLSIDSLDRYGLLPDDVVLASDHLPIISDFSFKEFSSTTQVPNVEKSEILQVFPNPSLGTTNVSFELKQSTSTNIQVIDQSGRVLTRVQTGKLGKGLQTIEINTSEYPPGLYFIELHASNSFSTGKLIVR